MQPTTAPSVGPTSFLSAAPSNVLTSRIRQLRDVLETNACIKDYGLDSQFDDDTSARYAVLQFLAETDTTYTQFPINDAREVLERYTIALFDSFLSGSTQYRDETTTTCSIEGIGCDGNYIDSVDFGMLFCNMLLIYSCCCSSRYFFLCRAS